MRLSYRPLSPSHAVPGRAFAIRAAAVLTFVLTLPALAPRTASAQLCADDRTAANFGAGNLLSGVSISLTDDGEVILTPALGAEFSGSTLPLDWADFPWSGGGGSVVGGGVATIDGSRINSVPAPGFLPGTSMEFVATFGAATFQHVGFGSGNDLAPNEIFNVTPWAIFSTRTSGTQLYASVWNGGPMIDTALPAVTLGVPHRFRIDWQPASIDFYVDGVLVHSEPAAIAGPMRPAASDFTVGGPVVTVDWVRLSPYATPGVYESQVFDGTVVTAWSTMTWTADLPAGTSIAMEARGGNTPVPDGSWTPYAAVPSSGSSIALTVRYVRYRATLATTDPAVTPALQDVTIVCDQATPSRSTTWGAIKAIYR